MTGSNTIALLLEIGVTNVTHNTLFLVLISPPRSEGFNYHLKYQKKTFFQGVLGYVAPSKGEP